jgi:hypothetical protein
MGLFDLIAEARECLGNVPSLVSFFGEDIEALAPEDILPQDVAEALANATVARAWHGSFFRAGTTGYPWPQWLCPRALGDSWEESSSELDDYPPWQMFADACAVAERIDDFLAVFERDRASTPLARACRHDLDTLPILADWCEENGLPLAAREARHLHDQVRYLRQG